MVQRAEGLIFSIFLTIAFFTCAMGGGSYLSISYLHYDQVKGGGIILEGEECQK